MAKRVNYLNNKDLLAEIHKSKLSFCWYNEEQDAQYDVIVQSIDDITDEAIEEAKASRAKRMIERLYE